MSDTVQKIVDRIEKRRRRLRSWVGQDAHPVVIEQVRAAHAALGAMAGILDDMAPALTALLIDAVGTEQQMRLVREEQKKRDKQTAKRLRLEAREEEDAEHAALLETMAKSHERSIDVPDMSELWAAGVLLTANKLYRTADQVSRSRDAEAIRTLGLKGLGTVGKWALKLTPIRQEDLQDLKDAWEALKTLTEPLDDATAALEAGKMRRGQAKAASSLFERLQVVQELAEAWSRVALQESFLARALKAPDTSTALGDRLHRARQHWT